MHSQDSVKETLLLTEYWQTSTRSEVADRGGDQANTVSHPADLCVLTFHGKDVVSFLQGYLTIDLARLDDGGYHFTALTNLQGRVVASGWCHLSDAETLDWVIHASLTEAVASFMKPYLAFARTEAAPKSGDYLILGLTTATQLPTVIIIDATTALDDLLASPPIGADKIACVSTSVWQNACIDAGLVLVTEATTERFLPQMLGLVALNAVDFDKGCYLGQEVVARAQHRGQVKRQLVRLHSREGLHGRSAEKAENSRADAIATLPGKALTDDSGRDVGVIVAAVSGLDEASDTGSAGTSTYLDCLAVAGPSLPATCFVDGIEFQRSGEEIS